MLHGEHDKRFRQLRYSIETTGACRNDAKYAWFASAVESKPLGAENAPPAIYYLPLGADPDEVAQDLEASLA